MSTLWFVVLFFRVVPAVTPPIVSLLWLAAAGAGVAIVTRLAAAPAALTPLLALQIFAASSGFAPAARRGHYDLLLTRGIGRAGVLTAHWAASIAPGLCAWLAVALVEAAATGPHRAAALTSGSLLALALASTLPWAVTVPLPRFAAAIGWLLLLVTTLAVVPSGQDALAQALRNPAPTALGAVAFVAYPMGALGLDVSRMPLGTPGPGVAVAVAAVTAVFVWFGRRDVPLDASS